MRYYTILGLLFLALNSNAQVKHKTVSGRLTDSGGMPMPGVNVVIKGTQIGTSTDADGSYSIDAPIGETQERWWIV
jgi:TonB-dependent starch-binding outer membrane protein SusC